MARIVEDEPTERVVVHERDHDHIHDAPRRSNVGLIVGIVLVILLLILLFGRGMFGSSSSGSSGGGSQAPSVNITPSNNSGQ